MTLLMHFNNDSSVGENDSLVYDWTGMGNNGTCSGSTCPIYNLSGGKFGGAFEFDGEDDDDYLDLGDSSSLEFSASDDQFSIFAWIKPGYNASGTIASKYNSTGEREYWLKFGDADPFDLQLIMSEDGDSGASLKIVHANYSFNGNIWYHVGTTIDFDTDEYKMYVNGEESPKYETGNKRVQHLLMKSSTAQSTKSLSGTVPSLHQRSKRSMSSETEGITGMVMLVTGQIQMSLMCGGSW